MPHFDRDELERRIDEVLFYIWDPIGVGPNPDARTEYRSYAKTILKFLSDNPDRHAVQKYLCEIEAGMLAQPANERRAEEVVELIMSHKKAIEAGRG
jgi:hypothetical protein